jgi:hypothetical protein
LGAVRETLLDGSSRASVGATVQLFMADGVTEWSGESFGQTNPLTTAADGTYAWYVPNGTYAVQATKSGFVPARRGISVTDHIVAVSLTLAEEAEVIPPEPTIPTDVIGVVSAVYEGIEQIRENPVVETAADVSIPVLAATAAISGLTLALSFNLLPFLQYLFTAPILFFGRRKRHGYGIVYNAVSKLPLDLATVRLFRVVEGGAPRFVQSRVTDRGGRYAFLAQPGRYVLIASKSGFDFPSRTMDGKTSDLDYLDVYHGEAIEVTEANATIAANIPLDPTQAATTHAPARVVWKKRLRVLQEWVAVLGVLIATTFAVLYPSVITIGMAVLQVVLYLVVRRLAKAKKPTSWGIVYDSATGKPLDRVVARIFEPQYNKLLETTVTDAQGRYSFLLGPSSYYAVFQKEGYDNVEVRPIDLRSKKDPTEFSVKVALPKKSP